MQCAYHILCSCELRNIRYFKSHGPKHLDPHHYIIHIVEAIIALLSVFDTLLEIYVFDKTSLYKSGWFRVKVFVQEFLALPIFGLWRGLTSSQCATIIRFGMVVDGSLPLFYLVFEYFRYLSAKKMSYERQVNHSLSVTFL